MAEAFVVEVGAPEQAVSVVKHLRARAFQRLDAFGPHPAKELERALGDDRSVVPAFVLGAAIVGAAAAIAIQAWTNGVDYPIDVGGRPANSWITHVPIAFETAALFGAVTAFVLALLVSGMPRLHHPLFSLEGFERTRVDRFWVLAWGSLDEETRRELFALGADEVRAVEVPS